MIPQFVGVEKLPWRGWFVINLVDDCDRGCTWLILGSVLSNDCLKHSPEDKGLSGRIRDAVYIVQKGSGEVRKLMVRRRRDEVVDGGAGGGGYLYSGILTCKLG